MSAIASNGDSDDDVPMLSAATLAALRQFALSSGVAADDCEEGDVTILERVRDHFDIKDRDQVFHCNYEDGDRKIDFDVKGVKRELGQTLSSTGLTIWRAAEHLCQWSFANPTVYSGKTVCELGAGLGMVSILLQKLGVCSKVVSTDGDDDTVELLQRNINENNESCIEACKLWWGDCDTFCARYPEKFDIVCAADVIYEIEQVVPLVETVNQIMKRDGLFYIAYARRNVPFDRVIEAATKVGLVCSIADEDRETSENIYCFRFN